MKNISIKDALKFAWEKFRSNVGFFLVLALISLLLQFTAQGMQIEYKSGQSPPFDVSVELFGLIAFIIKIVIDIGLIRIALDFEGGKKPGFSDLVKDYKLAIKYFLSSFLYGLITGVGLILLIIPGIYLALRLQFYSYLIVDKGFGPLQALKESWKLTKGKVIKLLLYGLLTIGLYLLGVAALIVGILVAVPITMLALAHIYRQLLQNNPPQPQPISSTTYPIDR
ncbi:hypothetical protein HYS97_01275 [Candidatus Daviesbacteria bacterium]|nr:hypothetical protein [Candidatus Daviesbacteria bacterium]